MNFFDDVRKIAASVALAYCDAERRELDVASAAVLRLASPRKFLVRFMTMTPAGFMQNVFVNVVEENCHMVARHPFINQTASFPLQPYLDKWFAPRPPSQQDLAEAAIWKNHCAAREHLFFQSE